MYLDIGDGPNAAIQHVQQVTVKSQKIARDLEIASAERLIRPQGNLTLFMSPCETLQESEVG